VEERQVPLLIAYPLQVAVEKINEAGYEVEVVKTLPPRYQEPPDAAYRVIRQLIRAGKVVELTVTIDPEKGGELDGISYRS